MELNIGNIVIRECRKGDEESIARHANNRKIWLNMRDRFPLPYTVADAVKWIEIANADPVPTNFAIVKEGEVIGGIGYMPKQDVHRYTAEIGYWLGEDFWGQGIATKTLRAMTEYIFNKTEIIRLEADIFEYNPASVRVVEKCGFQLEGRLRKSVTKDGRTIDSLLYSLVR